MKLHQILANFSNFKEISANFWRISRNFRKFQQISGEFSLQTAKPHSRDSNKARKFHQMARLSSLSRISLDNTTKGECIKAVKHLNAFSCSILIAFCCFRYCTLCSNGKIPCKIREAAHNDEISQWFQSTRARFFLYFIVYFVVVVVVAFPKTDFVMRLGNGTSAHGVLSAFLPLMSCWHFRTIFCFLCGL